MIEFFVPCNIEPKQGDRVRIAQSKGGKRFAMHYTPAKAKKNAGNLAAIVAPHRPTEPFQGPLKLAVTFQYPWRSGTSQKARKADSAPKDTKPDIDNLMKQISDVLQATGFIINDSQFADVSLKKVWTATPGIAVRIEKIG